MPDLDVVQQFVDDAARSRDRLHLAALLGAATEALGFDFFALVHHVDLRRAASEGIIALWTYPDPWVEEYLERRLATNDPVHLASHRTNVGFGWDKIARLITVTPAHQRVRERTRRAGIGDGFTVPANIPGEANGSCSFAMATGRDLPTRSLPAAQLIGAFAFQAARRLSRRRARIDPPAPTLSPRQIECVVLMGRGLADRETAKSLGIAEDTVTEYLDDARRRYNAPRRQTLVLRAIFAGQIALSDVLIDLPPS